MAGGADRRRPQAAAFRIIARPLRASGLTSASPASTQARGSGKNLGGEDLLRHPADGRAAHRQLQRRLPPVREDPGRGDAYFCIVDLHAITVDFDPAELREATLDIAAMLFATGLDAERSTVFVQSQVTAHAEAAWLLGGDELR